jgi:hypothetical protein
MFAIVTVENKIVLEAQSELGADYLRHLAPIAKELAVQRAGPKRIEHRGKPVTPFKIREAYVFSSATSLEFGLGCAHVCSDNMRIC